MTITKITNPITNNTLVNKVNEIIDDKQDILTVGDGINIDNGVISVNAESTTEVDLSNYALNNNVVHLTNNETIAGNKTFTNDVSIANDNPYIELHDNDFVKGNLPSSEPIYAIYVQDKTSGISQSNRLGLFTTHVQTSGTVWTGMTAYKNVANSTDSASIKVYYPTSGSPYTYAPTPTDTTATDGTQIATTGWVNSTGNNIVHKTGNETIEGSKTFIDNPYINNSVPRLRLLNTNITKGTTPSTAQGIAINFQDKDGNALGGVQTTIDTSKNVFTYLRAIKANSSTDTNESLMGIYYPATGNPYTRAPAPTVTTSTTSTQIATAGWVNSTGNNLVHLTEDETITGAKTFSNLVIHATDSFSLSILKNTAYSYTQIPNNDIYGGIWFMDKDGEPISEHYGQYNADGTGFAGFNFKNHSGTIERIGINLDSSGSLYTEAPIPIDTTSTTSTKIATTGWVNTIGNNVVHRSDAENINGIKTFKANPVISTGSPYLVLGATGVTKGINPTSNINCNVCFTGSDNSTAAASSLGRLSFQIGSSGTAFAGIQAYKNTSGTTTSSYFRIYYPTSGNPYIQMDSYLRPGTDDTLSFGDASHRWTEIYASTATINTSDERLKQDIENIPDEVLDAWGNVNFYQFKFKDMVKEKGENARIHIGIMAQRIKNIFEAANIDPFKYGLLCYDKWNSIEEEKDDENGIIISALKAGDRYSLRYEECLCMEAAYQRRRADRIEARLTVLEERL